MSLKVALGILSILPALAAYYWYFKQMLGGHTKPHAFSWLIWGLLAGTGFFAQLTAHAGIGAWVTGLTSLASLAIFGFAIRLGTTKADNPDKVLLALSLLSLLLLVVVDNKNVALCLTLGALIAGFVMTSRKAYNHPYEENAVSFALNTLKFIPAIFALDSFSFLTVAYPLIAALGNAVVAVVVVARARRLVPGGLQSPPA